MVQTFEAFLENRLLIWNDPINTPKLGKVIVTVLPVEKRINNKLKKGKKLSDRFEEVMKHLSKEEKIREKEIKAIRNEWERAI